MSLTEIIFLSGSIYLDKKLTKKETNIVIQAVDGGHPSKESQTSIVVRLVGSLPNITIKSTESFIRVSENKKNLKLLKVVF